ncbi:reverse transcriptase protein [Colletotrichum incanum]|nr:reverse transcriptase protein [Colletotrichum incanum]
MASSTSLEDNCALLAKEWEEAQEWRASEGITFDTDKSELIHFTKRPKDGNPPIAVSLLDRRQHIVQAVDQGVSIRWLGVHFDRRLTFKNHVRDLCAKACQVVNGLRGLGNTVWAVIPVYKTTPVPILQREAALPPAEVMLDAKLHKASVRIHRLDERHPLRTRLRDRPGPDSRLRRMASLTDTNADYIDPLDLPPWERLADWHTALSMMLDGSRTAAGAGWVGYQATREIFRGSEPLGHQTEPTLAHLKRESRAADLQAFARRWPSICPRQYADLGISPHPKLPELRLPRHLLGRLYAARSHHGDFAAYHERFAHQDALLHCSCGRRKTPVHFYFCKRGRKATPRHLRRRMAKASIDFLLGSTQGASLLCEWMEATNFFSEICPTH